MFIAVLSSSAHPEQLLCAGYFCRSSSMYLAFHFSYFYCSECSVGSLAVFILLCIPLVCSLLSRALKPQVWGVYWIG